MTGPAIDRRTFVAGASLAAAAAPASANPSATDGSIMDVEHVVILMQENRSFDHYFGSLRGVRGFDDPRPAILPSGRPVWEQRQDDKDGGATGPNRLYHWTGTSGLSVGQTGKFNVTNDGIDPNPGADMARDDPHAPVPGWTPYPARLDAAGISWRIYQEYDNYSDNPLGYFAQYRNLDRGSPAYAKARAWVEGSNAANADASRGQHLIRAFAADVAADRLPQVSWIVAPFHMCEHPDAPPAYGQALTAGLVAALAANPDVWAKTVFILNYDENDGFFDHVSPPLPATLPGMGASTIALGGETHEGVPVGLGVRVPLLVVSPWTRGGWVNSQLFDHISVLRFLERRFGVMEPNISPWRRAICGDLTSIFDFSVPPRARRDTSWSAALPTAEGFVTASDAACRLAKPVVADAPPPAHQEPGTRPARALPYDLDVEPRWEGDAIALTFVNRGAQAAVFVVAGAADDGSPRHYTVGAGGRLSDRWPRDHALTVDGPNGFHRAFLGGGARIESHAARDGTRTIIRIANRGMAEATIGIISAHAKPLRATVTIAPGQTETIALAPVAAHRWYDVTLTGGTTVHRLAGHWENGAPGISEPRAAV